MKVKITNEAGFINAINSGRVTKGTNHLYKSDSFYSEGNNELIGMKDYEWMMRHCRGSESETKWLRQINVWIEIEAPRFFWSQFDTYRIGVEKGSDSTTNNMIREKVNLNDFYDIDSVFCKEEDKQYYINMLNRRIDNYINGKCDLEAVKGMLIEAYMQKRYVVLNYQVLRRINKDRKKHKLGVWKKFLNAIEDQLRYPELIFSNKELK